MRGLWLWFFTLARCVLCLHLAASPVLAASGPEPAQKTAAPVDPSTIRFVHMGGNDCPPCVVWRGL